MKKTVIALSLVAASSWIGATSGDFTTGGKTVLGATGGTNPVCEVIATGQTATVNLSTGVSGAYDCSDTSAGVATKHAQGAGKTYAASSNGGKLSESTDAVGAAATAAKNAS